MKYILSQDWFFEVIRNCEDCHQQNLIIINNIVTIIRIDVLKIHVLRIFSFLIELFFKSVIYASKTGVSIPGIDKKVINMIINGYKKYLHIIVFNVSYTC